MRVLLGVLGWTLLALGFAILLLPGPAGWPGLVLFVPGMFLLLKSSRPVRRAFVEAARKGTPGATALRAWIRRRARTRRAAAARRGLGSGRA